MAEEQDSSAEKTQDPTPKQLEKAREEGDTVRSRELNTMAILLTGVGGMLVFGGSMGQSVIDMMNYNFDVPRESIFDTTAMLRFLDVSIMEGLRLLLPVFSLLLLAAFLGPIGLGGWNFTFKAVMPKASRMNPMSGLKRMFGPKALVELAKAAAKVLVVAGIALLLFFMNMDSIMAIQQEPTVPAIAHALGIIGWSVLAMSCAMILITMVDIPFQIHSHTQKLRMTHQQVKDEMKDTEGKPEVKQRIRQLQYQMSQNKMFKELPQADVVITNPQHYAVALKYQQGGGQGAPTLVAKGIDHMALRIREVATENKIPIVEAPVLARAIYYNTKLEDEIPEGLYKAVAQVLAYVFQLRQHARGSGPKPKAVDLTKLTVPEELRRDGITPDPDAPN
ncbi:flagellar biosynthesis protein FlhB [Pseudohongiella sp. SYSU M77423]|uniref:flagellar biosynthesis protein FlhB n=1 Tax=Pseudohongiella sp. SYSU M77423 TaxID=3042312 RepID=UPI002480AF37|nr:flagellar biosynthesis protein FlhB [Pseudohongiella sp. SYSU M77423]MDH7942986.1 flagellar biosynthesis protein FlhB [Pseudohongiella sp. SYSU M77423]